jgi:phenylpyruvate tautomerase PptA (4-oxalocrotonate tautomerase family)
MPFIDARIAKKLSDDQKEQLKSAFGEAIGAFGKGETWLMVQIQDSCDLWRGGAKVEGGAFLAVSMVGPSADSACARFSAEACDALERTAGVAASDTYITVTSVDDSHWGWNGGTF